MFEHMITEKIKINLKNSYRDDDGIDPFMKPVQFRPSFIDRTLLSLGEAMISVGLKLKERPSASLTTEQAQSPNFLIML
jgi:hypothetical protein